MSSLCFSHNFYPWPSMKAWLIYHGLYSLRKLTVLQEGIDYQWHLVYGIRGHCLLVRVYSLSWPGNIFQNLGYMETSSLPSSCPYLDNVLCLDMPSLSESYLEVRCLICLQLETCHRFLLEASPAAHMLPKTCTRCLMLEPCHLIQ